MTDHTPFQAPRLMTPAEVRDLFRVHNQTVIRWANRGYISTIRTLGGHRRYDESEIRALLGLGEVDDR